MLGTQATKRNVRAVSIEVDTERYSKEEPMETGGKEWCQTQTYKYISRKVQ
jgi:hypothetical protein